MPKKHELKFQSSQVMAYFRFQIWIHRAQVIQIHLFSSRDKTQILNSLFSFIVVIVIVPLLPFVK
jgi:hypothetical protein